MLAHVPDVRRLAALLEDECAGRPFDRHQAAELARHLADICPEMGQSLRRISERMEPAIH